MDPAPHAAARYRRFGHGQTLAGFLATPDATIIGELARRSAFDVDRTQIAAWESTLDVLRSALAPWAGEGHLFLEFDVPRLGRRIDAVLVLRHVVFVIEFKVGAKTFLAQDIDQVIDYALDLKHFHETSHAVPMAPLLVATGARAAVVQASMDGAVPNLLHALHCTPATLATAIALALEITEGPDVDALAWVRGRYRPRLCGNSPTLIGSQLPASHREQGDGSICRGPRSDTERSLPRAQVVPASSRP